MGLSSEMGAGLVGLGGEDGWVGGGGVVGCGVVRGSMGGVLVPVMGSLMVLLVVSLMMQWVHRWGLAG